MKKHYRPLPNSLTIKQSNIEGLGLFAIEDIEENNTLGLSHILDFSFPDSYIRTPLGGFVNHSDKPNCEFIEGEFGELYLKTIKLIKKDSELTATYTLYNPN